MKKLIPLIIILLFASSGWGYFVNRDYGIDGLSSRRHPKAVITRTYCAAGCDYDTLEDWKNDTSLVLSALTTVDIEFCIRTKSVKYCRYKSIWH